MRYSPTYLDYQGKSHESAGSTYENIGIRQASVYLYNQGQTTAICLGVVEAVCSSHITQTRKNGGVTEKIRKPPLYVFVWIFAFWALFGHY